MCHMSRVMWHVSSVTCQVSSVKTFFGDQVVELVGVGSVINEAYPIYFFHFVMTFPQWENIFAIWNLDQKWTQTAPRKKGRFFWSLQTILLFIVQELAEGGSIAVAVGISDMWQVTCNMWMWQITFVNDTWLLTHYTFLGFLCIGATIGTHQEIQCLLYAGLFLYKLWLIITHYLEQHWIDQVL